MMRGVLRAGRVNLELSWFQQDRYPWRCRGASPTKPALRPHLQQALQFRVVVHINRPAVEDNAPGGAVAYSGDTSSDVAADGKQLLYRHLVLGQRPRFVGANDIRRAQRLDRCVEQGMAGHHKADGELASFTQWTWSAWAFAALPGNFLTMALRFDMRITPRARVTVTTIGKPSGMAATALHTGRRAARGVGLFGYSVSGAVAGILGAQERNPAAAYRLTPIVNISAAFRP